MPPVRNRLIDVIDSLPEEDQMLLFEIASRFVQDDIATPEDIATHEAAVEEYRRGETVPHSAINWD